MKILCVADHVDPIVYSAAIKQRFADVELVLSAGDLPMEYLSFIASGLNKLVIFVFGNHNLKALRIYRPDRSDPVAGAAHGLNQPFLGNAYGATYIGGKVLRTHGLLIAGLGGSIRYNNGENQFTESQMYRKIVRMVPRFVWNRIVHGRFVDIVLTHSAPRGINDRDDPCHTGFKAFLWLMKVFKPRYLLHGHVHLYDLNAVRIARYRETTVINVYDHYILEI
ncbi:MAG: metallophosphoesterase [Spirochaetaceae bacterium]|nr:MAG: metallophosphoesterase [Spirochaetaceae bacterium]